MQLFLKILSGMAKIVDPDQTAPSECIRSNLGLHCLHMPFCQKLLCTKILDIYLNLCWLICVGREQNNNHLLKEQSDQGLY